MVRSRCNRPRDRGGSRYRETRVRDGGALTLLKERHLEGNYAGRGAGSGSPEMDVTGRVTCERVVEGEKVLAWKSHWVMGWDVAAQEYGGAGFDSTGVAAIFRGT